MFGHEFERENVRHFVEAGREGLWNKEKLTHSVPVNIFIGGISISTSVICFLTERELELLIPGSISLILIILMLIYIKKERYEQESHVQLRLNTGIGITVLSLQFLISTVSAQMGKEGNTHIYINISIEVGIYLLFVILFFGWIFDCIKKDRFRPKTSKAVMKKTIENVAKGVAVGGALASIICVLFLNDLSEKSNSILIAILGVLISIVLVPGMANFLKAYYIKKYGFTDPYEDGWYKPKRGKLKEAENEESTQ